MNYTGRQVIYGDETKLNKNTINSLIQDALMVHNINQIQIEYLWNYYKGKQPILSRTKKIRQDINNKIVENRAYEIVNFKTSYLFGEPIQYVSRGGDENISENISELNEMMFSENKASKDKELGEWNHVCGTSYRLVLPNINASDDEAPFEIYTLDPRNTFVVYSNKIGNKPICGVTYYKDRENIQHMSVYTKDMYFELEGNRVVKQEKNPLKMIPIIEYPLNNARLGSFEKVLHLLDALNNIASNRMDGIEQQIQSFIKFVNCDISEEDYERLLEQGAIKVKSSEGLTADVDVVKVDFNQDQAQTMSNNIYQSILTITGLPNRNGGSSTSDTGAAVNLRDGWNSAELNAKDSELIFKKSEQEFLKVVLKILREKNLLNLRLKEIGMQFTRRNYENILAKSQVLVTMLGNEKIHPLLAFTQSGMFTDPEKAYSMSMEYYIENHVEGTTKNADERKLIKTEKEDREVVKKRR